MLLYQTEPFEEGGQFELGSGGPGGNTGKVKVLQLDEMWHRRAEALMRSLVDKRAD